MAPKMKALAQSNARQAQRRAAVALLSGLAVEVGISPIRAKSGNDAVETLVRALERKCQTANLSGRLHTAASQFCGNGGIFTVPLLPVSIGVGGDERDTEVAPSIQRHRVLDEGFRIQSKAFMLTYNCRAFTPAVWTAFLRWVKDKRRELGARRWAACLEKSENAQPAAAGGAAGAGDVYHLHAYFLWADGEGLRRRNTDDLVFAGVRPRVDVCVCQSTKGRQFHAASAQGLWYVALKKTGTLNAETNYIAWRDFIPKGDWLRSLWNAKKMSHEMYLRRQI